MQKILSILFVVILALHGLIHLMGTITYLQLGAVDELVYKTTLLNGSWEVGQTGMAIFGIFWALAALGFVVSAAALLGHRTWAQATLVIVTLLSLALTGLDWNVAYAGVMLNVAILALCWFGPQIGITFLAKEMVQKTPLIAPIHNL